jgi:hypothetical protein
MGHCGTMTVYDAAGESLHTIRRGCMPDGDAEATKEARPPRP